MNLDSKDIKYKFKKLSPMNYKKINKNIDEYFIKIDEQWFNLVDIYDCVKLNQINPITKQKLSTTNIKKIVKLYKDLIEVDTDNINNEKLLTDYIELFEYQINELYTKQEEIYALTQIHQHEIEKINIKI